jgi:hypothetical protein
LIAFLIGSFITSEFNGDALLVGGQYGSFVIPGVGHYGALPASVSELIIVLPFLLGRRYLRSSTTMSFSVFLTIAGRILAPDAVRSANEPSASYLDIWLFSPLVPTADALWKIPPGGFSRSRPTCRILRDDRSSSVDSMEDQHACPELRFPRQ